MMKKLFYYLFVAALFPAFQACSDDDDNPTPPPSSKGEEAVVEIVETLESKPEVSQFVELLKKADMANVAEEKLTVFAVKNQTAAALASRADASLDEASLKRHIAKGSYSKDQLTDGMQLESINGETLYITRTGNDVFVNGVVIEGEAIPAGNSFVYVVPEVIQKQEAPASFKHQTTINVKELAAKYIMDGKELPPLAEVTVTAKDGNSGKALGKFKTDAEGVVVISHDCDTLVYNLSKADFSDLDDGKIYAGTLSADGNYMFKDLNGDGKIDNQDKVYDTEWPYQLDYRNVINEANSTQTHFMVQIDKVAEKVEEITKAWATIMNQYRTDLNYMNRQLLTGEGGFSYNDVAVLSERYITLALKTEEQFEIYRKELKEMGEENTNLDYGIQLDILEIRTNLYEYYGFQKEELILALTENKNNLPQYYTIKPQLWLAKVYLLEGEYDKALNEANDLMQSNNYQINSITENETLLVCAVASYKLGRTPEALEALNKVRILNGMEEVTSLEGKELIETCHMSLIEEGQPYSYYRILEEDINCWSKVEGFDGAKHHLLPYPQYLIDEGIVSEQNPGYN